MKVDIGEMKTDVLPVDEGKLVIRIVDEVLRTLDQRRTSDARRAEDSQLWSSVRSGTGR